MSDQNKTSESQHLPKDSKSSGVWVAVIMLGLLIINLDALIATTTPYKGE